MKQSHPSKQSINLQKGHSMKQFISQHIVMALDKIDVSTKTLANTIVIEQPPNSQLGDYATNVAMVLFSRKKGHLDFENPRQLAQALVTVLSESLNIQDRESIISKIEIAGPGFINFFLSDHFLLERLKDMIGKKSLHPQDTEWQNMRVVVEYTDPNPFKEFHIGHLYSNIVGESIARLLEANGATVWRADFFGDVGMHVAKSIWGLLEKLEQDNISLEELSKKSLSDRVQYLGQGYALGATAYQDDKAAQQEIKQINFLAFKAAQQVVLPTFNEQPQVDFDAFIDSSQTKYKFEQIKKIYALGRKWSLAYFETIYARLGTTFDGYYPESRTGEYGYGMTLEGLDKGIFEKGEAGAIIYPGEKRGLHNRVFINALGLPTYETKDFGLAVAKNVDFPYDKSVIVTGNEINEYFQVVISALTALHPELGEKTHHIGHGMVRLPEGKMSSRTGKILRGEWLLDEAKNRVLTILSDTRPEFDQSTRNTVAEKVALAAIKYAFLKSNIGGDISFNFEDSLSFQGNSGPYLQYSYVRCVSVLAKANCDINEPSVILSSLKKCSDINLNMYEKDILKNLYQYSDIQKKAAVEYAPHCLCTYLYNLAQNFNAFYAHCPILLEEKVAVKNKRLAIVFAVAFVLKSGLRLLGIETVAAM